MSGDDDGHPFGMVSRQKGGESRLHGSRATIPSGHRRVRDQTSGRVASIPAMQPCFPSQRHPLFLRVPQVVSFQQVVIHIVCYRILQ